MVPSLETITCYSFVTIRSIFLKRGGGNKNVEYNTLFETRKLCDIPIACIRLNIISISTFYYPPPK